MLPLSLAPRWTSGKFIVGSSVLIASLTCHGYIHSLLGAVTRASVNHSCNVANVN